MSKALLFAFLVFAAGIASTLLHELGHCLSYWLQGVSAGMSLTKEFPLRDISALEYAVGSAGGPLANLTLLTVSLLLFGTSPAGRGTKMVLSAVVLANVFYFVLRGLVALLRRRGGELSDVAGLVGLGFEAVVLAYAAISIGALFVWMRLKGIRLSFAHVGSFLALLVGYLFFMAGIESIDSRWFWSQFPTIQIDDGRTYNEKPR